ncbi:MAG: NADH-quinone oxidoreductase subunit J [Thermogemmata sp.]|jgi:NADH-quinone oxidoreductase subunit J|uniref:NADH-quinone oxidoreductase subunit J n=1 Tax=Thermogemmata fonticola TaxID=2755323 RepID=A0A7V8VE68_9BACT|nr:NADH-quinone oxidoreductase subunit J [Thermogemmata fonticola]MBA2226352.1 NADH-quinone oxidoreductase subunit J [Thermogemmata fonticola]MCX8139166.1 NADH-quinone oxidoreductase subunit J [Gemmataceae bacterium]
MTLSGVLFVVIAAVVAVSALGVVLSRHIVRMAVWLLFTLVGVALLYFLLGAEFLGAAQMIVYVGGTLVLLVFGVMLTAQGPLRELRTAPAEWAVGGILAGLLLILVACTLWRLPSPQASIGPLPGTAPLGLGLLGVQETTPSATLSGLPENSEKLGRTPVAYLLPFEIVSVHLLVVLIGAAYLARARKKLVHRQASTELDRSNEAESGASTNHGAAPEQT